MVIATIVGTNLPVGSAERQPLNLAEWSGGVVGAVQAQDRDAVGDGIGVTGQVVAVEHLP